MKDVVHRVWGNEKCVQNFGREPLLEKKPKLRPSKTAEHVLSST